VNQAGFYNNQERTSPMAREHAGVPGPLLEKVKEAAAREEITVEERVRDALETASAEKGSAAHSRSASGTPHAPAPGQKM
jgi:hypothetical protein